MNQYMKRPEGLSLKDLYLIKHLLECQSHDGNGLIEYENPLDYKALEIKLKDIIEAAEELKQKHIFMLKEDIKMAEKISDPTFRAKVRANLELELHKLEEDNK